MEANSSEQVVVSFAGSRNGLDTPLLLGPPTTVTFQSLPDDVLKSITSFLAGKDIANLEIVSSEISNFVARNDVWQQAVAADFAETSNGKRGTLASAKHYYKQRRNAIKQSLRSRNNHRKQVVMERRARPHALFWFGIMQAMAMIWTGLATSGWAAFFYLLPAKLDGDETLEWWTVFLPLWIALCSLTMDVLLEVAWSGLSEVVPREPWPRCCRLSIYAFHFNYSHRHTMMKGLLSVLDDPKHFWNIFVQFLLFCGWPIATYIKLHDWIQMPWGWTLTPIYAAFLAFLPLWELHRSYRPTVAVGIVIGLWFTSFLVPLGSKADGGEFLLIYALIPVWILLGLVFIGGIVSWGCGVRNERRCLGKVVVTLMCVGILLLLTPLFLIPIFFTLKVDGIVDWSWHTVYIPVNILFTCAAVAGMAVSAIVAWLTIRDFNRASSSNRTYVPGIMATPAFRQGRFPLVSLESD